MLMVVNLCKSIRTGDKLENYGSGLYRPWTQCLCSTSAGRTYNMPAWVLPTRSNNISPWISYGFHEINFVGSTWSKLPNHHNFGDHCEFIRVNTPQATACKPIFVLNLLWFLKRMEENIFLLLHDCCNFISAAWSQPYTMQTSQIVF